MGSALKRSAIPIARSRKDGSALAEADGVSSFARTLRDDAGGLDDDAAEVVETAWAFSVALASIDLRLRFGFLFPDQLPMGERYRG